MSITSYALCQICLESCELSTMHPFGPTGYICRSCEQRMVEEYQAELEIQALDAELAALEASLDPLDTLPVNLGAPSVAKRPVDPFAGYPDESDGLDTFYSGVEK